MLADVFFGRHWLPSNISSDDVNNINDQLFNEVSSTAKTDSCICLQISPGYAGGDGRIDAQTSAELGAT